MYRDVPLFDTSLLVSYDAHLHRGFNHFLGRRHEWSLYCIFFERDAMYGVSTRKYKGNLRLQRRA